MTSPERQYREAVDLMAQAYGLDLPKGRLETLARTFADFMDKFDDVWAIDPGDREPPAIVFDDEVGAV